MKELTVETSGRLMKSGQGSLPRTLSALYLVMVACILPLCFGGTHETTFVPFAMIGAGLAMGLLVAGHRDYFALTGNTSRMLLMLFTGMVVYVAFQYIILSLRTVPHPLFGHVSSILSWDAYFSALLRIAFFFSLFLITRTLLQSQTAAAPDTARAEPRACRFLYALSITAGVLAASIALLHWFYDNGLLFWTFAPEIVAPNERARWPFVNPNHLADFVLLSLFPAVAVLQLKIRELEEVFDGQASRKGARLSEVLSHHRVQRHIMLVSFSAALIILMGIAILATLSRGGWLGACCGLLLFVTLTPLVSARALSARAPEEAHAQARKGLRKRRRRHGHDGLPQVLRVFSKLRRYAIPMLLLATIFFLLQGKGAELVEGRLEYGLLYAKSDMRWQLYRDTLPLIRDHLWFGVGAGNWENAFLSVMSPMLAGVNPEYLHSDPLQLIAEFGIAGSIPFAMIALLFTWKLVQVLRGEAPYEIKMRTLGLACGMFALVVSSFVEFPFRIPAIAGLLAIECALFCALADNAEEH